jgi:hypothetical protein
MSKEERLKELMQTLPFTEEQRKALEKANSEMQTLPFTEEQRKALEKANSEMQTLPFTEEQRKALEKANSEMQKYSKGGSVTQYDQLFLEKGKEYGVDPMILKGIASVESNFKPKAEGPKTRSGRAQGMMQFIPAMQKPYGITDPFDPEQSVTGAARMMRDLLKRYKGDVGKALEAYNGGPRLVGKSTQTRQYAEKVQRKAQLFAKSTQKPTLEVAGTATQGPSALSRTPQVSQQPPKFNAKPKTGELTASLDDLGNDYKAAIALTYLSEDDDDGLTVTERAEQLLADQEEDSGIRGDALSQIFTMEPTETEEAGPFDVYAAAQNPQPQQSLPEFNEGGFVFGGTSLPGMPNPFLNYESKLTPEVRNILEGRGPQNEQYQQELAEYQRQVDDYNKGVLQYQDQYKQYEQDLVDYQSQVDAYNNEVNAYNDLAKGYTDRYQGAYNRWLSKAEAYNRQVEQIQQKQKVFDAYADVYNQKVIPLYTNKNLDPPDFNLWAKEVAEGKRFALEPDLYDKTKNRNQSWSDANKNLRLRLGWDPKKPGAGVNPFPGSLESIYANLPTAPEEFKYDDPKVAKPTAPTMTAPTFSKEAPTFSREKPVAPTLTAPNYDAKKLEEVRLAQEDAAKYGKQRELALHVAADPNAYNLSGFGMAAGGAVDKSSALDKVRQFLEETDWSAVGKGALDVFVNPPTTLLAGLKGTGWPSALALGLYPNDLNANEDELLARYRAMAERERSTPQPPMAARSNGSPPYGEDVDMQMFGSTGDRSMDETKKGLGRSVDAIRRGVQYHPADLLGTPVDVINMLLEPVGLGSEKPFMGSEYLIDKGVQAGIYEKPTGEGEETLARFAAGMINPTLGLRAIGKAAEGIETLGKTPPAGAVTLADQVANVELKTNIFRRSDDKPFVGELESLLQGLGKEEVTPLEVRQLVTQYKESLGSKMERRKRRVLEERIDEIFENRDPNTPIDLTQIYSDLERTSPKRLTQEILGPEYFASGVRHNIDLSEGVDNPYKNEKPLGVTTILFDTPKGVEDLGGLIYDLDKSANGLQDTFQFIGGDRQISSLALLQQRVKDLEQIMPSSQLSNLKAEVYNALDKMPELQKLTRHLNDAAVARPKSAELDAVESSVRRDFPDLFGDPNTAQLFNYSRGGPYADLGGPEQAMSALAVGRATHRKVLRGLINFEKELVQQGKINDTIRSEIDLAKFKLSKSGSAGITEFDSAALYYKGDDGLPNPDEGFQTLRREVLVPVLKSYQAGVGNEVFRTVRKAADKVVEEGNKLVPFGQARGDVVFHEMNRKGRNAQQLGFTRFVEFEPTDTILAPYSSSGPPRVPVYNFPESKKGAIFATELQSDMRRAVPDPNKKPLPGQRPFETPFNLKNQEALRDLLIKNMVDVAVKRNRDLVLFPGADSARPELYENLHKFVETTAKDLGPNFKAVEVMTVNGEGKRVVRSGIFITPEGEKEILEKGLKFAKGGMVDKPLYDRAA